MTQIVIELWTEHLSVAETAALELGAGTQRNIEILQPQDVDQLMYRASALSLTEAIDAMRSGATVSLRLLDRKSVV